MEAIKNEFMDVMRRVERINSAIALLAWDQRTIAPPAGREGRAQTIGVLSSEAFRLGTSAAYGDLIAKLEDAGQTLSEDERRMVTVARREYDRNAKLPADLYESFVIDAHRSEDAWGDAKRANDYAAYEPHLQKMIDYARKFADLWGYEEHPYDALLEGYEPGMTVKQIDGIFAKLREDTVALLGEIPDAPQLPEVFVPEDAQRAIGLYLLREMGYDLDAGNLFTTEHPFMCTIHEGDARVTTHFYETAPASSIFSIMHEGGHGMYEQNIDKKYAGSNLFDGASMAVHESQSRFWENIIGRSRAFWDRYFDKVNAMAGGGLAKDAETFVRGINRAERSLIRIEADEVTYNLHIIIRYELEKEIIAGHLTAKQARDAWNDKYKEYLGIVPPNDSLGIMQDVHWSDASFGYFPSYTLGNLYAAQFAAALEREVGSLDALIRKEGGLGAVKGWLGENIHRYGSSQDPGDIIRRVTGEPLNARYLVEYLRGRMLGSRV